MTSFGLTVLRWVRSSEHLCVDSGFVILQLRDRFPDACARKVNSTVQGCIVAGYLNSARKENGDVVYWMGEDTVSEYDDLVI